MTANNNKYCIFPISLIGGMFENKKRTILKILHFVVKKQMQILKYDTYIEKMLTTTKYFGIDFFKVFGSEHTFNSIDSDISQTKIAKVKIKVEILLDYFKNEKSEFEIECFCGYCALKSMIGNKKIFKGTVKFLLSRMFPDSNNLKNKYKKHYHYRKLMKELEINWGLKKLSSNARGFYFSFTGDYDELEQIRAQKKAKWEAIKQAKRKAILTTKNEK